MSLILFLWVSFDFRFHMYVRSCCICICIWKEYTLFFRALSFCSGSLESPCYEWAQETWRVDMEVFWPPAPSDITTYTRVNCKDMWVKTPQYHSSLQFLSHLQTSQLRSQTSGSRDKLCPLYFMNCDHSTSNTIVFLFRSDNWKAMWHLSNYYMSSYTVSISETHLFFRFLIY